MPLQAVLLISDWNWTTPQSGACRTRNVLNLYGQRLLLGGASDRFHAMNGPVCWQRWTKSIKVTPPNKTIVGSPMSNKGQLLQDPFLNTLRREHIPVSIYLVNGIKLQGQVESFDQYVVLLKNTVTQMVYKHAISTVVPVRPVNFTQDGEAAE